MPIPATYEHITPIGQGYFADVLKYKCRKTGELVALKRMRKPLVARHAGRFRREVRLLKTLKDVDGVVPLLAEYVDDEVPSYLMPAAAGNIADHLRQYPRMSIRGRADIFEGVCKVVAEAHSRKILHRDISPTNVLARSDEEETAIWVCDFGLGKSADSLSAYATSEKQGYGQAYYVAPEQLDDLSAATTRSDVFSLGRLLDFLMTGRQPNAIHPHAYRSVAERATRPLPESRYESAGELLAAFSDLRDVLENRRSGSSLLLDDLADIDGTDDWDAVYQAIMHASYSDHVYSGWLRPVMQFFGKSKNINGIRRAWSVEEQRQAFARYSEKIDECVGTVGWPFNMSSDLVMPFIHGLGVFEDTELLKTCFLAAWKMATDNDQWDAEKSLRRALPLLHSKPDALAEIAAALVANGKTKVSDEMISAAPPGVLRRAMQKVASAK